jgi:hypothetical protein
MRRFHIQRTEEDADEGTVNIVRTEEWEFRGLTVEERDAYREIRRRLFTPRTCESEELASFSDNSNPWTCDPCGSTNVVDRGNCAFCGKPR